MGGRFKIRQNFIVAAEVRLAFSAYFTRVLLNSALETECCQLIYGCFTPLDKGFGHVQKDA